MCVCMLICRMLRAVLCAHMFTRARACSCVCARVWFGGEVWGAVRTHASWVRCVQLRACKHGIHADGSGQCQGCTLRGPGCAGRAEQPESLCPTWAARCAPSAQRCSGPGGCAASSAARLGSSTARQYSVQRCKGAAQCAQQHIGMCSTVSSLPGQQHDGEAPSR